MKLTKVEPLHFHCPSCNHCAGGHALLRIPEMSDDLVLVCDRCEGNGVCPAHFQMAAREITLANIHAQEMHISLWRGLNS